MSPETMRTIARILRFPRRHEKGDILLRPPHPTDLERAQLLELMADTQGRADELETKS